MSSVLGYNNKPQHNKSFRWVLLAYLVCTLVPGHLALGFSTATQQCRRQAARPPTMRSSSAGDSANINRNSDNSSNWKTLKTITTLSTPWMTLQGERLLDNRGQELDYWRVEKEDSAVIITIMGDDFILPEPSFRPGLGRCTFDFPGGRIPSQIPAITKTKQPMLDIAAQIVGRELGLTSSMSSSGSILDIQQINQKGWPINSSFSNQLLFGFVAHLDDSVCSDELTSDLLRYSTSPDGIEALLADLECLQCRMVLCEWLRQEQQRPHQKSGSA